MSEAIDVMDVAGSSIGSSQKFNHKSSDIDVADLKAEEWVGVLENKELDNKKCLGEVVGYYDDTKSLKMEYENIVSEEVDCQELKKTEATPPVVTQYSNTTYPRWYFERETKRNERHQQDTWVPIHPRYHSSIYKKQVKPRKKKCKKEASTSTYIPLAFRETKKDAYYYY